MAVPTHFHISFRGVFDNTEEMWMFGLNFGRANVGEPDTSLSDVDVAGMATDFDTFASASASKISSLHTLTEVRGYQIGTNGLMEGNPEIVDVTTSNISGVTTNIYPPQVALVVTSVGADRGPGRYGRVFLPTAMPISSDFLIVSATATAFLTAYTNFVKACSDRIDRPLTLQGEQHNISAVGPEGAFQVVDHHEVGRALDTLRSRRKGLLEQRVSGGHIDW